jgi:hypothetical protein
MGEMAIRWGLQDWRLAPRKRERWTGEGEEAARCGGSRELTVAGGGEVKVLCERRRSVGAAK